MTSEKTVQCDECGRNTHVLYAINGGAICGDCYVRQTKKGVEESRFGHRWTRARSD